CMCIWDALNSTEYYFVDVGLMSATNPAVPVQFPPLQPNMAFAKGTNSMSPKYNGPAGVCTGRGPIAAIKGMLAGALKNTTIFNPGPATWPHTSFRMGTVFIPASASQWQFKAFTPA